jgi:hypothetical protein
MAGVLEMRATVMFGQVLEAIDIRMKQALSGNAQARMELAALAKLLEPTRLSAASKGLSID